MSPAWCKGVLRFGEEEREPALKGWNETDGLLAIAIPSNEIKEALRSLHGSRFRHRTHRW